jgi:hypothetical protein
MLSIKNVVTSEIDQFLKSKGIFVIREWLEECIKFVRVSSGEQVPLEVLKEQVFQQYLYSDHKVIGKSLLGSDILEFSNGSSTLGIFALQIKSIEEIGVSIWQMIGSCERLIANGITQQDSTYTGGSIAQDSSIKECPPIPRKTLKVVLTDGFTSITCVEFRRLPFLSMLTPLGCKVSQLMEIVRTASDISVLPFY